MEEVEIVQEEYLADPVQGSSSDSTGKIMLARSQYFFTLYTVEDPSSDEETPVFKPQVKALLLASMEEVRQMDFSDNRGLKEDLNTTRDKASDKIIVVDDVKLRKTVSKKKKGSKIIDIENDNAVKRVISRKSFTVKPFTPEEDKILLEAVNSGEKLDIRELAKKINRRKDSVRTRLEKFKSTGVSTKTNKSYSFQEDLLILDSAIRNLEKFSKLDDTPVDTEDLSVSFRRTRTSVYERWELKLKSWLKSYYSKTLNLEIRVMLANVLADNFENIVSVDWNFVKSFDEFSGHTIRSLKQIFFGNISRQAKYHSTNDKTTLTLREIANDAAVSFSEQNIRKISQQVLKRQGEVVEYFEKKVKEMGIKNFL